MGNIGDMKRMRLRALPILEKQKATETEKERNPSIKKIITVDYQTFPERERYCANGLVFFPGDHFETLTG